MEVKERKHKRRNVNLAKSTSDDTGFPRAFLGKDAVELPENSGSSQDSVLSYSPQPCLNDDLPSNSGAKEDEALISLVELPQNVIHMILVRAGVEATVEVTCTCRTLRDYVWKVEVTRDNNRHSQRGVCYSRTQPTGIPNANSRVYSVVANSRYGRTSWVWWMRTAHPFNGFLL